MTPKQVKAIRLKLGLTQVQFAKQLNYTQANISKWESGAIKLGPRASAAIKMLEIKGGRDDNQFRYEPYSSNNFGNGGPFG